MRNMQSASYEQAHCMQTQMAFSKRGVGVILLRLFGLGHLPGSFVRFQAGLTSHTSVTALPTPATKSAVWISNSVLNVSEDAARLSLCFTQCLLEDNSYAGRIYNSFSKTQLQQQIALTHLGIN